MPFFPAVGQNIWLQELQMELMSFVSQLIRCLAWLRKKTNIVGRCIVIDYVDVVVVGTVVIVVTVVTVVDVVVVTVVTVVDIVVIVAKMPPTIFA